MQKGKVSLINYINNIAESRIKKYGAPYLTFAIFGVINYPLAYLLGFYYNQDVDNGSLWLRLVSLVLCVILLFKDKWPANFKIFLPLYWYITITIVIPVLGAFMIMKHGFSLSWIMNFNIGVMILILLVDTITFMILELIGITLGFLLFYLANSYIVAFPNTEHLSLFIYVFFCEVIIGSIFARNREIFNHYMQRSKDEINASLEQQVEEQTYELKQALAAKAEFLNNISHEIRTPIQGMTNLAAGVVEHWNQFDDQRKLDLTLQVEKSAKRLYSLVGNLLDLSKFTAGKMLLDFQRFDLNYIINDIIDECNTLYISNRNIKIEYNNSRPIEIIADQERISQVLRNLFVNAIKFSADNSAIIVNLTPSEITYDDGTKLAGVHLAITDEGIGIPEDEIEAIFNPFTQSSKTKTKAGGTGLGLAIVKEIIEIHGGKIWANNNINGGATFHFILPITSNKQIAGHKVVLDHDIQVSSQEISSHKPATILIIDDEEICLLSFEMLFHGSNYKVIKAKSAQEGLSYLKSHPKEIDLIMLDLMMPDMYGLNLLAEIKQDETLSKIPVILQSGSSDQSEIEKAFKMGISDYIKKPYNKQLIYSKIAELLF